MSLKQLQFVLMLSAAATMILTQGCKSSSTEEGTATEPVPVVQEEAKPEVKVEEPAPAVEQPAAPAVVTTPYVIQKGDTISGIAVRHNLRWQDVMAVNEKLDPKKLRVGKTIQLPGKVEVKTVSAPKHSDKKVSASGNYTVQNGDSLGLIAKKHGTTVAAIKKSNNLSSDVIRVGQKLNVPGAKAEKKIASKKAEKKTDAAAKTETAAPVVTPPPAVPVTAPAVETAPAVAPAGDTLTPPPATPVDAAAVIAPVPAVPAVPAAAAATQTHTVREGEDLYAIAIRWGVSPTELKNLNGLTSNEVKPGQVLKIPVAAE